MLSNSRQGESVRVSGSPDISLLSPELQQQWHANRNGRLGPIKVKPHSDKKAVWQCNKCPAGQPHIWTATVLKRTEGTQCPCTGTTARMRRHQSRCCLAATSGLSGSVHLASGNGERLLCNVSVPGAVALSAVVHSQSDILFPHLQ